MNYPVKIGIVGGGQLGKMLTIAAKQMGFFVTIIDPTPGSPAGQIADKQIIADYNDPKAIKQLEQLSHVITVEVEVNDEEGLQGLLESVVKRKTPVEPSPRTFKLIQDKLKQKEFLKKHTIATAPFCEIKNENDITKAAKEFGYPLLLKARTGAYDGKGNYLIEHEADIPKGMEKLGNKNLYAEAFVPFVKELAIMVARNTKGEIKTYPVVETIHINHICDTVAAPASISQKAKIRAEKLARDTMEHLGGAGVFGIEMFLKKDDTVCINEIAPRVHNSGHYTIEATPTSQFEQHIRAITGLPLGQTDLLVPSVVMKNILGTRTGPGYPKGIDKALAIPNVSIHMYGKHESRTGRKMGHITVTGKSIAQCLKKANEAREVLVI